MPTGSKSSDWERIVAEADKAGVVPTNPKTGKRATPEEMEAGRKAKRGKAQGGEAGSWRRIIPCWGRCIHPRI